MKFKHIEDTSERGFIKAVYPNDVVESLQILKLIEDIRIEDEIYTYAFSEFVPALSDEFLDVVYVYLDKVGYDEEDLGWLN